MRRILVTVTAAATALVLLGSLAPDCVARGRKRGAHASLPPWRAAEAALVLDPYHGNEIDLARVRRNRHVVGIIHKATEGTTVVDDAYESRRVEALELGFLWGSYHFGRPGDVELQVDAYLAAARPEARDVIALDVDGVGPEHMSLDEAAIFVSLVHDRTGRYPLLYATPHVLEQPMSDETRAQLARCPLWFARFRDRPVGVPRQTWPDGQVLWQFSSEIRPICRVGGADAGTDVNLYNGRLRDIRAEWPFTRAELSVADAAPQAR